MQYTEAAQLVAEDQRQSYPDMSDAEAIDHARQTLSVQDQHLAGGTPIDVPTITDEIRELITAVIDRNTDHRSPERLLAEAVADLDEAQQLATAYRIVLTNRGAV